ncbi:penicillin-binding protein 1C [Xenophilus arseniciresistens]|uniref:peptidoglycan glycosyltransferase n=1 Tax=Xenophilus arseniciresistens TaxID=1283306 RepID=A0AAE3N789_9BURK|nr:penicillin-binding protein 1C [Xenophilus arseniciresistens]MDA7415212.1 penicillin-binding protein 1C [Xenophilus arseniciresistens]
MKTTRPAFALLAALCLALPAATAWALPAFEEVRAAHQPSDVQVLDRQGVLLQRVRTDASVRRGQWVALADVSPALRTALVLSEDRRFHEHSGVDWRAVSAAAWGNLWNTRTRGASTLTMQLAGLLDEDLRRGRDGRSFGQKIGQALTATQLERRWRKDQILEAYLNSVPFRGELVGIDALSRTLFGKAAHGLDDREAAVAAALVRAPNASPARVAERACEVMRTVEPTHKADCGALQFFTQAALARRAFDASEGIAPHVARQALRQQAALQPDLHSDSLRTTLRAPLQRMAVESLQRHLRELRGRHVEDGALVVLDNASGEVLAWIGSSGTLSRAREVDAVLAPRQPGSTLKPLLYAQAIAERRLTAASLLEDSSAQIPTSGGLYIPQNYDRSFKGTVSVRTALAASLNVPAVRTLVMVTPEAFARQLRSTGIALRESGDYYGFSLALGSAEVRLLDLTNSFRTLANGGRFSQTRLLLPEPGAPAPAFTPVLDPGAAFIVGDILSDGNARARTFGTDSVLATRFWSAVKTGTSKDMRDNWAVGWSERYTVGVWVGNASGAPMWDVSGISGAAPVWAEVMAFLHAREPSRAPAPPAGVQQQAVRFGPAPGAAGGSSSSSAQALEAAREEWFLRGTAQALFTPARLQAGLGLNDDTANAATDAPGGKAQVVRIAAPADGTILALDPDIPPRHQRVRFEADGVNASTEGARLQWRMDGKTFARGAQAQWLPWPGRHTVELADARGQVLHSIRLEVRGAGVAAAAQPGTASRSR